MSGLLNLTFYITYVFLITTGSVTFIEALATKDPMVRHILNIETVISIVAGFFYSRFVAMLSSSPNYTQLLQTRYLDWSITTPFMLLSLCLALGSVASYSANKVSSNGYRQRKPLYLGFLMGVIALNYGMLLLGYLGEMGKMDKKLAWVTSFMCFGLMFGWIWQMYLGKFELSTEWIIFGLYVILWSIYGFVYFAKDETKHTVYNVLDLCAKCLVGLFFWLYFTGIIAV